MKSFSFTKILLVYFLIIFLCEYSFEMKYSNKQSVLSKPIESGTAARKKTENPATSVSQTVTSKSSSSAQQQTERQLPAQEATTSTPVTRPPERVTVTSQTQTKTTETRPPQPERVTVTTQTQTKTTETRPPQPERVTVATQAQTKTTETRSAPPKKATVTTQTETKTAETTPVAKIQPKVEAIQPTPTPSKVKEAEGVSTAVYEPVEIVRQISPAGKAALEHTKDNEYLSIVGTSYESPAFTTEIIRNTATDVKTPSHVPVYSYSAPESNVWQNVEYHRYGNNLMESHHYLTPAEFQINDFGRITAKAPHDSSIRVISSVPQIQAINFLDIEDQLKSGNSENNLDEEPEESFEGEDTVFNHFLESID